MSNVAETILSQLGGAGKLSMMCGCNNYMSHGDDNALSFRVGKNGNKINYCKVTLTADDLYNVEYGYIRAGNYTVQKSEEGIYNDMLRGSFETATGMYLTF
tara:strand:- start:8801 stop:9103 length:303 start_codon:yes stop_codon:yes gene_type:complete